MLKLLTNLFAISSNLLDPLGKLPLLCRLAFFELLEHYGLVSRQERNITTVKHLVSNILLEAVVLIFILLIQINHQEHVHPHVVVLFYVHVKSPSSAASLRVKCETVDAADETRVLHIVLDERVGLAQLRKRVDDDAKDHIEQDGDHYYVEAKVEEPFSEVFRVIVRSQVNDNSDVSGSQTLIKRVSPALEEIIAHFYVFWSPFVVEVVEHDVWLESGKCEDGVQVNDNDSEESSHTDRMSVLSYSTSDRL
mmetsp:Transcript_4164/g.6942  ORF Transcript_4164/g.6942 Transcript_4164/m.6942 type:complete len:251 (+) Transcript_4164:658-1410(+)